MNETYVVIDYLLGYETDVVYAGQDKQKADDIAKIYGKSSRVHVWVNGEEVRHYDIKE